MQDVVERKWPMQVNDMTRELQNTCEIWRKVKLDMIRNLYDDTANETYHHLNCMVKAATRKQKIQNLEEKFIEIDMIMKVTNHTNSSNTFLT